jgi:hypothetical protein
MSLPSHVVDGIAEATWSRRGRSRDVRPESGSMTGAMMCDCSRDLRPKSGYTYIICVYNG